MTTFGELFQAAKKDGAGGDVLPEGDFAIKVIRAKADQKDGKPPRIGLQLEIVGAAVLDDEGQTHWTEDAEEDDAIGRKAWSNIYFTEKAAPISFRFLGDLGLSDEFIAGSSDVADVADALVGVVFTAGVSVRSWGRDGDQKSNAFKVSELVTPPSIGSGADPTLADEDDIGF